MTATILDGKALAEKLRAEVARQVAEFVASNHVVPCLAAVLVGDDPASQIYVRNKQKACDKAGIQSRLDWLPATTTQEELLRLLQQLNSDDSVHGILVQLPLPKGLDEKHILDAVHPLKDVDALHPENVGRLVQGRPRFLPCTPSGIQQLLAHYHVPTAGSHVVVVGRSDIVGKPMAILLFQRGQSGDATVTVCHSRTKNLPEITRQADILIVAIGQTKFITADMVKPGAVVVDVGMNRADGGLFGDVDFQGVREVASHITPVPGGVGLLTITMLLQNTLEAARLQVCGR